LEIRCRTVPDLRKTVKRELPAWTTDAILRQYKFTNVFRACDRMSQFLIRDVIYEPSASTRPKEVVFRILLFKLFNSVPAWEYVRNLLGIPTWKQFDVAVLRASLKRC
jgi:alpha-glutamyl/putrescinyl thymine pyrophosphorylase clade 1